MIFNPTRWFAVHCVKLTGWWRGTGLCNNIPIPNMKHSSAERSLVVMLLCWLMTVDWWRGRSWVWLTQLRTVHSMIHLYQKCDWRTNEQTILNDSSRQTKRRKLNQGKESWNPSLVISSWLVISHRCAGGTTCQKLNRPAAAKIDYPVVDCSDGLVANDPVQRASSFKWTRGVGSRPQAVLFF